MYRYSKYFWHWQCNKIACSGLNVKWKALLNVEIPQIPTLFRKQRSDHPFVFKGTILKELIATTGSSKALSPMLGSTTFKYQWRVLLCTTAVSYSHHLSLFHSQYSFCYGSQFYLKSRCNIFNLFLFDTMFVNLIDAVHIAHFHAIFFCFNVGFGSLHFWFGYFLTFFMNSSLKFFWPFYFHESCSTTEMLGESIIIFFSGYPIQYSFLLLLKI